MSYSPWDGAASYFKGYLQEVCLLKGVAKYVEKFSPSIAVMSMTGIPAADDSPIYDTLTPLAMNFDGVPNTAEFADSCRNRYVHTYGNVVLKNTDYVTGGCSALFDGAGDFLLANSDSGFAFGASDFTIEFYVKPLSFTANIPIVQYRSTAQAGNDCWSVELTTSKQLVWRYSTTGAGFVDYTISSIFLS